MLAQKEELVGTRASQLGYVAANKGNEHLGAFLLALTEHSLPPIILICACENKGVIFLNNQ